MINNQIILNRIAILDISLGTSIVRSGELIELNVRVWTWGVGKDFFKRL